MRWPRNFSKKHSTEDAPLSPEKAEDYIRYVRTTKMHDMLVEHARYSNAAATRMDIWHEILAAKELPNSSKYDEAIATLVILLYDIRPGAFILNGRRFLGSLNRFPFTSAVVDKLLEDETE